MGGHYILKLNNKCNLNCLFCADSRSVRNLDEPQIDKVIKDLKENSKKFDSLIITGGEPTIYPNLFEALKVAREEYRYICLVTNGMVLGYDKIFDRINRYIDSYQISYISDNPQKFNSISRTDRGHEMVNRGIENAVKSGKEVRINIVLNKMNYVDIPEIVKKIEGVSSITLCFMNPLGDSVVDGISKVAVPLSELMPYVEKALEDPRVKIENFPVCVAEKFYDRITDLKKPEENKDYYNCGKTKLGQCQECMYDDECDGVWREYITQFGNKEIKPIMWEICPEEKKFFSDKYNFEIEGIELGLKKGSIFYVDKEELENYITELNRLEYSNEISEFSYDYNGAKTIKKKDDSGKISIYVSKDPEVCKRLKYLDYYHQFEEKEPNGMKKDEVFYEIAEILGYPKCCSDFVWRNGGNQIVRELGHETGYPLIALEKSERVNHLLNNFDISYPKLMNYYFCSYDCKNSIKIAEKLKDKIKEKNPMRWKKFEKDLRKPILFFSANKIIRFPKEEGVYVKFE